MDRIEQKVATLQESNVKLLTMVGEMREIQHRDQTKIIGLQSELEEANRKHELSQQEIRKCKAEIGSVESKLALLSTKEETMERFDRIEQMLSGAVVTRKSMGITQKKLTMGKRKDKVTDIEAIGASDDEDAYADSQELMDHESIDQTQPT
jgi:chromosome segregation ATPase